MKYPGTRTISDGSCITRTRKSIREENTVLKIKKHIRSKSVHFGDYNAVVVCSIESV